MVRINIILGDELSQEPAHQDNRAPEQRETMWENTVGTQLLEKNKQHGYYHKVRLISQNDIGWIYRDQQLNQTMPWRVKQSHQAPSV